MSIYTPSDNPQNEKKKHGEALRVHEDSIRAHGPVPPNYLVERYGTTEYDGKAEKKYQNVQKVRFTETSYPNASYTFDHPLSAAAQNPVIRDEPLLDRKIALGVFDAPIRYKADKNVKWKNHPNWQAALADAMAMFGVRNKDGTGPITAAEVQSGYNSIPKSDREARYESVLYHPTDRDTMVWEDEPAVAMTARKLNFSVIIFCPFTSSDGIGYNRFYDTKDRPPTYARFSVGRQGFYPPLVLGCLPKQTTRQDKGFHTMWYSIEVNKNKPPSWYTEMLVKPDMKALADTIGFPATSFKGHVFLWSLVSLHRRIVVGYGLPDEHLACWMWQFGDHLVKECKSWNPPQPCPFNYDAKKLSEYKKKFPKAALTFIQLTRVILNPFNKLDDIWIGKYALPWDQAIDAMILYHRNKNDANWAAFKAKMSAARKLPF